MMCGNCGRQNPPGALYCLDCGQKLRESSGQSVPSPAPNPFNVPATSPQHEARPATITCPRCSTTVNIAALYCGVCGLPAADMKPAVAPPVAPVVPIAPVAPVVATIAPPPQPVAPAVPVAQTPSVRAQHNATLIDPPAPSAAAPPPSAGARTDNFGAVSTVVTPQLVTILKDGSEGPIYRLTNAQTDLGRYEGTITLPDDPYLSPRHARIQRRNDRHYLRDLGSVNGIFHRIREPVELHQGDVVLVGQQVLRVEILADAELSLGPVMHYGVMLFGTPEQARVARLVQLTSEGVPRDVFHLYRDETVVGRESGDIVFTDDVFLSRRHVAFKVDKAQRRVTVRDLGSSNGTLVLFRGEREVVDGDIFRIGHHLFRFDTAPRSNGVGAPGASAR